jgi:lysophospholipase L1-like esterase
MPRRADRSGRYFRLLPIALGSSLSLACLRKSPPAAPEQASSSAVSSAAISSASVASTAHEAPIEIPSGPEVPDQPSPRRVEQPWMSLKEWRRRHEQKLNAAHRLEAKLVVLGDSIVEGWADSASFRRAFADYKPLNLGIGGDQTQHLLWRIDQGILDGSSARVAVVLIGVNNLGNGFAPEETVRGIAAVLERVRAKLPAARVLLLAVLPAGETPEDGLRTKITAANAQLAALALPPEVRVADVGRVFLEPDGRIPKAQMADFLHPTAMGQERLTEAVRPLVAELMAAAKER